MTEKQAPTMMMTPDQLRGLIDTQPIGYVTANGMRMLIQDEATVMLYRHDYLIRPDHIPLYTHPAPAAPQAMEDANVWKQIVPDDAPQAEPKREPNPDEVICPACTHQFRAIPENVQKQLWAKREPLSDSDADYWLRHRQAILDAIRREGFVLMSNACGFWLKRMDRVSEAHGIGGSDAE